MSSIILRIFLSALSILFLISSQSFAVSYNGPVEKISGKHEIFFKCFDDVMYSAFTVDINYGGAFGAEITCEPLGEDLELNMFFKEVTFPDTSEDLDLGLYVIMDKFGKFKHLEPMVKMKKYGNKWKKAGEIKAEDLGDISKDEYQALVKGGHAIAREVLNLVEYKKKKSYKNNSVVIFQNLKRNMTNALYLELTKGNINKSELKEWKKSITNSNLPNLNFKLVGKVIHDGRPAYLLNLEKKIQGGTFKGYTIIDQATGFALVYKQYHTVNNQDYPGVYVSSFSSDKALRSKIQRIDNEETSYKVSEKILETKKKNAPKVYISDEERAKRINDFVQKHLSDL